MTGPWKDENSVVQTLCKAFECMESSRDTGMNIIEGLHQQYLEDKANGPSKEEETTGGAESAPVQEGKKKRKKKNNKNKRSKRKSR